MNRFRRLTSPGILRLYLAAAVVAQHLGVPWLGTLSVLLFFVLSGYWICALWKSKYRRCRQPYWTFMLSRYWRLLPVYLTCVLLAGLCLWRFSGWWQSWTTHFTDPRWVLSNLFILGCASQPRFILAAWSLDVEMQFYLIAPIVIFLTYGITKGVAGRAAVAVLFGLCVLGFLCLPLGVNLGAYLLFFAAGCALAHLRWRPSIAVALPCALAAFAIYLGTLYLAPSSNVASYWSTGASDLRWPALAFVAFAFPAIAWLLEQKSDHLDRILGDLAYPVYLFHLIPFLLLDHVRRFHNMAAPGRDAVDIALVAIGSLAIYLLIDKPIERKRRKYIAQKAALGSAEPAL
jgi:peptidoglycan/LPS O-acetylase OafA/YrhL